MAQQEEAEAGSIEFPDLFRCDSQSAADSYELRETLLNNSPHVKNDAQICLPNEHSRQFQTHFQACYSDQAPRKARPHLLARDR